MISVALQILWTRDVKAIAAKVERRVDRAMPWPRRAPRRIERCALALEGPDAPVLLEDQRELFGGRR
jgi:hypothetical protein